MSKQTRLTLPVVPACRDAIAPHEPEFVPGLSAWDERLSRRSLLQMAAASSIAALAAGGCNDRPNEPIVPYVDPPEQVVAGEPQFFATTLTRNGYGLGVIVTSREGRPVKIEGNPDHPASLGAADAQMQAAVLDLYDPLRSRAVTEAGVPSTWGAFVRALRQQIDTHAADGGAGLAVLTGTITSPTIGRLMAELKKALPRATWYAYEPLGAPPSVMPIYDFSAADVVVSFGNDFLSALPGSLAYARQFMDHRRPSAVRPSMNRLYVTESDFTLTGTKADHRLAVRPTRLETLQFALAAQLGMTPSPMPTDLTRVEAAWLSAVATDLAAARGRGLVLGESWSDLPTQFNQHLGNIGKTVSYRTPVNVSPAGGFKEGTLAGLTAQLQGGTVRTLLIAADNPARCAPADLPFAAALAAFTRSGGFSAHLGLYANETAYACRWHLPAQHDLERWGDAVAYDGTPSLVQPLISPLHDGHDLVDLLHAAIGRETSAYEAVRSTWRARRPNGNDFEIWWTDALRRGTIERPAETTGLFAFSPIGPPAAPSSVGIDVVLRADPSIGDGAQFHNPWLQELPRPLTKIVWGNAALLSPATAERHGLTEGDVVRLEKDGRHVEVPIVPLEGLANDTVVLHLGYGEHRLIDADATWAASNVPRGTDAFPLMTTAWPTLVANATLTPTGRRSDVGRTRNHHAMAADEAHDPSVNRALTPHVIATPRTPHEELALHHRKLIRTATLAEYFKEPDFAPKMDEREVKQLYPSWDYSHGPQWGMTIDLTACIGCNACVVACQAENNIPSVGPEQVEKQREMHWLRVDSYLDDAGHVHHQPVPCMHCENAPCEYVCPVAATTHSVDGLNQMTYNRCVGTRYCSNNCPYKVRRFNFLNYTFYQPESHKMQRNPDVTVRTRGVMEKCTYCVQRLVYADRKAEIAAVDAGDRADDLRRDLFRRLQTACQQTCPTRAIHFGDLTDADTEVAKNKHSPLNYGLLTELSTRPRTTYLASITNPSPSMEPAS